MILTCRYFVLVFKDLSSLHHFEELEINNQNRINCLYVPTGNSYETILRLRITVKSARPGKSVERLLPSTRKSV